MHALVPARGWSRATPRPPRAIELPAAARSQKPSTSMAICRLASAARPTFRCWHCPCSSSHHVMSNCVRIAGFIVLAAALTACADDLAPEVAPESPSVASERATVSGHVVDAQGVAIAGATVAVRASGEHAMTDAAGAFSLDVPANTTLTLSASAPSMAPTLLQQLMVSPSANAAVEISMVTADHFKQLAAMGHNPAGGVVAVALKSMSGTGSLGGDDAAS